MRLDPEIARISESTRLEERQSHAFNPYRKTGGSRGKLGSIGLTTSSIRHFCCSSSGGTTQQPACAA
jgi:hypothetical protein